MSSSSIASVGDEATIVLSGIGTDLSDNMLMNMYRTYGSILRVRHNGTNSAQVVFVNKAHALRAVKATNGAVVYGKTLKVSLQRQFKKSTEPCRGFVAGICRKGDMCKYYHVTDNAAFAAPFLPVAAKPPLEPKTKAPKSNELAIVPPEIQAIPDKKVCHHFSRGYCSQGEQCRFAHVLGLPVRAVPASTGKVAQLCLFFQSGVCARGDACRYVHEPTAGAAPDQPRALTAVAQSSRNSDDETEAKAESKNEDRICVECEKPGVAVWRCAKCDNSIYCEDCNAMVHRARVMAKHKRINLPPLLKLPRCGECESKISCVRCEQCDVPLCASCDAGVHKFKSLQNHVRVILSGNVKKTQPIAKEPAARNKVEKKKKLHVKSAPHVMVSDPVPYVESVPQLEFSSDSESESEDEEMENKASPIQFNGDEPMATEVESDEDFDDVKPSHLASAPVIKARVSHSSGSEFDAMPDEKLTVQSTISSASVRKIELSSDSDSSDDECVGLTQGLSSTFKEAVTSGAPSKPAVQPPQAHKGALATLSSESESDDDDEIPPVHVVKQAKKLAKKTQVPSVSSNGSKNEALSKPTTKAKATPALKSVKKKPASGSSSESSSDSSIDEALPLKSTTPAPLRAPTRARSNTAGGISVGSSHTLVKKIEAYNESSEAGDLHLDAYLNGFERLLAHDCAERLGLAHVSIGSGLERHIIISRHGTKRPAGHSGNSLKLKKSKHRRH